MTLFLTVFGLFENHKVMVTFFFDCFDLFENTNVMMPCFLLFFWSFRKYQAMVAVFQTVWGVFGNFACYDDTFFCSGVVAIDSLHAMVTFLLV